ncbi:TIGR04211 family SH3 domain-containing protein [Bowmanella sp. Y26]|uniref:TIGR04211 family SH3 domain-containing protein n=1 Tax=Bowmanella yangjiangensis TaxID=2811230 RepID=A0ABS3CMR8_9ALTE|nr:TIGR04211 family SH3 domain-containing protein [Bowmanella yangjiangensis]MBN7818407.1 TIGR04211 family SH3 domain-containing protein [Bowmanella yangjiangensis]MBT1062245.1 TIGR04211 family SH3 domain-containing protein [Bowmanella yangjiangensis]
MQSPVLAQEPNDADGETVYIADDLYTFMHAGPGRNYRILGSVTAGTKVTLLQRDNTEGFVEIIDDKQRTGWVDSRFINENPSVREAMPQLQQNLSDTQVALQDAQQKNDLLNQQILDLNSRNKQMQSKLDELQTRHDRIERELSNKDNKVQLEWLTRGGIIGLVGIVLGVIVMLIPRKRRRNDGWM